MSYSNSRLLLQSKAGFWENVAGGPKAKKCINQICALVGKVGRMLIRCTDAGTHKFRIASDL